MSSYIDAIKAKIAANPFLSMIASAGTTYVAMKYGPAISVAQSFLCK